MADGSLKISPPPTREAIRKVLGSPLPDVIDAEEEAFWAEYDSEESRADRAFDAWGKGQ